MLTKCKRKRFRVFLWGFLLNFGVTISLKYPNYPKLSELSVNISQVKPKTFNFWCKLEHLTNNVVPMVNGFVYYIFFVTTHINKKSCLNTFFKDLSIYYFQISRSVMYCMFEMHWRNGKRNKLAFMKKSDGEQIFWYF